MPVIEGLVDADTLAEHPEAVDVLKYNIAKLLLKPLEDLLALAHRTEAGPEILVDGSAEDAYDPDAELDPRIEWKEHVHPDGAVHVAGYLSDVHVSDTVHDLPSWLSL